MTMTDRLMNDNSYRYLCRQYKQWGYNRGTHTGHAQRSNKQLVIVHGTELSESVLPTIITEHTTTGARLHR